MMKGLLFFLIEAATFPIWGDGQALEVCKKLAIGQKSVCLSVSLEECSRMKFYILIGEGIDGERKQVESGRLGNSPQSDGYGHVEVAFDIVCASPQQ